MLREGRTLRRKGSRMRESDFEYFSRRADEEALAATTAANAVAARIHRDMAQRFRDRAQRANGPVQSQQATAA
jgi:hypothetical protein